MHQVQPKAALQPTGGEAFVHLTPIVIISSGGVKVTVASALKLSVDLLKRGSV